MPTFKVIKSVTGFAEGEIYDARKFAEIGADVERLVRLGAIEPTELEEAAAVPDGFEDIDALKADNARLREENEQLKAANAHPIAPRGGGDTLPGREVPAGMTPTPSGTQGPGKPLDAGQPTQEAVKAAEADKAKAEHNPHKRK